jgi:FAD/FMN-containing dehydrogenase
MANDRGVTARFDALVDGVQGPVLFPGQDDYDEERSGFQTAFHHRPAVIVGALDAEDVRTAVQFANANGLPVAVQATGHGLSVRAEDGVLISTRRMTGVHVDPEARAARIQAGVRWEQVIEAAAQHRLAPLSGSAPHVGAVGYTLGGGLGLLGREFGFAADHVRSIDVVTADGELRHVTADSDPDLFWALRGGRDNFGVATSLEVALVPLDRIYGGGLFFDVEYAEVMFNTFREWTAMAPETLTASVGMIGYPPAPTIPEPLRGRHVLHLRFAYTGDVESGERLVEPLRAIGPRVIDEVGEIPFTEAGSIYDDPSGALAYHGNSALLRELDPKALGAVRTLGGPEAPAPCIIDLRHLGGALSRPPAVPNAVAHREAQYILRVLSPLASAELSDVAAAHQRIFDAVQPWTIGRSLNFIYGRSSATDQVSAVYDPQMLTRLAKLKAVYDPNNTFRYNHNIEPAK